MPQRPADLDLGTMTEVREIARILTAHRHELGISQLTLAEMMGISVVHLWRLENGKSQLFTAYTLIRWCRALGVTYTIS